MGKVFLPVFLLLSPLAAKEKITLTSSDGCELSAYENVVSTNNPVLLEMHGLGSSKEEWDKFNSYLEKEKIGWLAFDMRGHGESKKCAGKTVDYNDFTPEDWAGITKDLTAGYRRLLQRFPPSKIIFAGASIGANAALIRGSASGSRKLLLLSPGLDYAGLKPLTALSSAKQNILVTFSLDDGYARLSAGIFRDMCEKKVLKCSFLAAKKGHGVQIFDHDGDVYAGKIINWIKNKK